AGGMPRRTRARPLLIFDPKQKKPHGPSRAQGVCVQPAMDGRRPALGAGRGQAGGAHPLCTGRAARTTAELTPQQGAPTVTSAPRSREKNQPLRRVGRVPLSLTREKNLFL